MGQGPRAEAAAAAVRLPCLSTYRFYGNMHSAETCDAERLQDYGAHAVSLERDMAHEVFYFTVAVNKDAEVHPAQLRWPPIPATTLLTLAFLRTGD